MALSLNDELLDATIAHQLEIIGYSTDVSNRVIAILNRSDADLMAKLQSKLETMDANSFTVQRLEKLLVSIRALNGDVYEAVRNELYGDLKDLTAYELDYQQSHFKAVLPVDISVSTVAADAVYAAALSRPFQGKLLKEWASKIEADRMTRIRDAIRIGYIQNETISQMVQRIRGTRALKYTDGLLNIDRRVADAVVRTAVSHTANVARNRFYERNDSLIKGIRLVETLDHRTCEQCMALDGKIYPTDSGPRPPHHMSCRGSTSPVIKSWSELGIDAEDIPESTRASMDGQVPEDVTYGEWLKNKPASFQDEVLGKSKGKLFRDGGLTVDRFVDRSGRSYTLDQLRERNRAAFERAGL